MKTCLVVEDSKVIRVITSKALQEMDFNTIEAENGEVALSLCKGKLPDFILLDWLMPIKDGLSFLEDFKKLPGSDKVPVIFCSSKNDPEDIKKALSSGAREYIMKPFDSEILRLKLMQIGLL